MQPLQQVIEAVQNDLEDQNSTRTSSMTGLKNDCSFCRGTTWVQVEGSSGVKRCECQKRKIAEARIRVILKNWPEYSQAKLEDFKPKSVGQANAFKTIRENPRGSYFLTGYFSRGKTHLLVMQYRILALAGDKCILRSARDLMQELRKEEAPPEFGKDVFHSPVLQMVNEADFCHLFIDDIEKAPARSSFREEMLFDLLDTIKRRQLGITVTSNQPLKELSGKLGDAVVSRLYQLCKEIEL